MMRDRSLGSIHYATTSRLNLGLHRNDANVIWDLASHDFSILFHVLGERPVTVQTDRKSTRLNSSHANISYAVFCLKKKKYTLSFTTSSCYCCHLCCPRLSSCPTHSTNTPDCCSLTIPCITTSLS